MSIIPADTTTVRVDQLPPDSFLLTDIFPFETLADQTLKKATFQDLVNFINLNSNAFQHEIKELFVNQEYIDNNIDETGLGINLLAGWRLATELDGLVTIGYGATYTNIGGYGGSANAVVVEHSHDFKNTLVGHGSGGVGNFASNSSNIQYSDNTVTKSSGASGTNKNMQPYCVVLKIIKL